MIYVRYKLGSGTVITIMCYYCIMCDMCDLCASDSICISVSYFELVHQNIRSCKVQISIHLLFHILA